MLTLEWFASRVSFRARVPWGLARSRPARGGTLLMEAAAGLFVTAVTLALATQLVIVSRHQLRQQAERAVAVREAANVLDQVLALPWDQRRGDRLRQMAVSRTTLDQLAGCRLSVEVTPEDTVPAAQRICVLLTWVGRSGGMEQHVRFVSWDYSRPGGAT